MGLFDGRSFLDGGPDNVNAGKIGLLLLQFSIPISLSPPLSIISFHSLHSQSCLDFNHHQEEEQQEEQEGEEEKVMENNDEKTVVIKSSSFRLRSPSLNALRLHRIFDLFDKNGDGFITVEELSQALTRLGLEADFSDLKSTVESYIQPGNTGLNFDDFSALHKTLDDNFFGGAAGDEDTENSSPSAAGDTEESDLAEAFKVFDENGDGFISARELQVVLKKLGLPEGGEMARVEKMIGSVDKNQDGRVDFFEFKNMMRTVVIPSS